MIKLVECPTCHKKALRVEVASDEFEVLTSGRPLAEMPCQARCQNCFRKIKYAVEKKKDK